MTERPYVWHESKFPETRHCESAHPWTVTLGRPRHCNDFMHTAPTLEAAMAKAISLVPKEVP